MMVINICNAEGKIGKIEGWLFLVGFIYLFIYFDWLVRWVFCCVQF